MPARFCRDRRSRQSLHKGTVTVSGRVNDLVGNVRRGDWSACLLSGKDCLAVLSTPASSKRWIGGFNRLLYLLVRDQAVRGGTAAASFSVYLSCYQSLGRSSETGLHTEPSVTTCRGEARRRRIASGDQRSAKHGL